MSWRQGQTGILTQQYFFLILAGLLNRGSKPSVCKLILTPASYLQLIQTVCAPGYIIVYVHLLPLFFRLFPQVHLLIDGSVEDSPSEHLNWHVTFAAFWRKLVVMDLFMPRKQSDWHSLQIAASGTFSLPENQYISIRGTVFSTQAHCDKPMFRSFVNIFFWLKHSSPYTANILLQIFRGLHFWDTKNFIRDICPSLPSRLGL